MVIVSSLVFEKNGITAERFFKTKHTAFYRFADGEIFTATMYEMRVSPLGVAGIPFVNSRWVIVEDDHLIFEEFSLREFEKFDPKVKFITRDLPSCEKYAHLLMEKAEVEFRKILSLIEEKKYEKIAGLGPGLTPLGDDILSGMIIAGYEADFPIATNDISKQQLIHAKKRLAPLPVKEFLETGDDEKLLDMGATSGAGWAFGITYILGGCKWFTQ